MSNIKTADCFQTVFCKNIYLDYTITFLFNQNLHPFGCLLVFFFPQMYRLTEVVIYSEVHTLVSIITHKNTGRYKHTS